MDASSTTTSAPVAAPAVPSAAAPGAMPAAALGVSSMSDAWKISPKSAGWSAYPPAMPFEYSGASRPAQLARTWRQVGITAPRNADKVPVKFEDKYVPAELCLLGQRSRGAIALRALVDSGAHFTSLSLPIVEMMERTFPGVQMPVPFSLGARQAVRATGQKVSVTERTIPLQLALVTPWAGTVASDLVCDHAGVGWRSSSGVANFEGSWGRSV